MISDLEFIRRLKEVSPQLKIIIDEHLPGDFSNWEVESITRHGETKTVDVEENPDPTSSACAFKIFHSFEHYEDVLQIVQKAKHKALLAEMSEGLAKAERASLELSMPLFIRLEKYASERLKASMRCRSGPDIR